MIFELLKKRRRIIGKVLKYVATLITLTVSTFFIQSCM